MIFVHYEENGAIQGFYDDNMHNEIPMPTKEINHEQWQEYLQNQGKYLVDVAEEELTLIINPNWVSPEEQEFIDSLLPSNEEIEEAKFEQQLINKLIEWGMF